MLLFVNCKISLEIRTICLYTYTVSNVFKEFYKKRNPQSCKMFLKPVSDTFVLKELQKLNASKSTGLDNIPSKFLKDGAECIKAQITHVINLSITTNVIPSDMKDARVRPIYKKNSKLEASNYRPVSILCIISKILERSVYVQLVDFLNQNNLFYENQSGFRSGFSTDTCLIYLLDLIRGNTSKGQFTGMIMLDLQKAFDTVNHDILCEKLKAMGVMSTEWFSSYLSYRKQVVSINNECSDFMSISCGVPQGSILGPVLFLCYVNDMQISIDSDCQLLLYADDSVILFSHNNPEIISQKLGLQLESCSKWLVDNKLSLHLGKTECMLFGPQRKLHQYQDFSINCNGTNMKAVQSVKYLGLQIDNMLSGENIVMSIIEKVNARLKFLYRHKKHLDFKCRQLLSSALIQCYFDYACSSWYAGLTKTLKNKLQVTQNKVVRFILDLEQRASVNNHVLERAKMLCVNDRVKQLRLNHVYNIVHGTAPQYMFYNFTYVNQTHVHNTRASRYNFMQPPIRGKENGSFFINAIKDWNSLPDNVKGERSKVNFKGSLKTHLFNDAKSRHMNDYV